MHTISPHLLLAVLVSLVFGCAGPRRAARAPLVIAVMPLDAVGEVARQAVPGARGAMHDHLRGRPSTRVVPLPEVDRALASAPACQGERQAETCSQVLGRTVGLPGSLGTVIRSCAFRGRSYDLQVVEPQSHASRFPVGNRPCQPPNGQQSWSKQSRQSRWSDPRKQSFGQFLRFLRSDLIAVIGT